MARTAGALVALPCEACGSVPTHAHHANGYDDPLDVTWLCAIHHREAHGPTPVKGRLKYLTLPEAAAELGLAASTLRHQVRRKRLAAHKIGPYWYVTTGEVERYRHDVRKESAA